tara:strand:+ start:1271 stop:1450 length:180 start_codon:yes stop_codon:yes gene_type:complete
MAIKRLIPDPGNYRDARRIEYPQVGDVVDAIIKHLDGDSTDLDAVKAKRAAVKTKHPKE